MSPYGLLQEEINYDPWKIFVCCIFCNLTKRVTAEPYFRKVLELWPRPIDLACANESEVTSVIQPLGLSKRRAKALVRMSREYLEKKHNLMHTRDRICIKTRQYAKRQRTWARGQMANWQKVNPNNLKIEIKKIQNYISKT